MVLKIPDLPKTLLQPSMGTADALFRHGAQPFRHHTELVHTTSAGRMSCSKSAMFTINSTPFPWVTVNIEARNQFQDTKGTVTMVASRIALSGFPGGAVVKNPPANAGDTGSSPGPGRSHMLQSN